MDLFKSIELLHLYNQVPAEHLEKSMRARHPETGRWVTLNGGESTETGEHHGVHVYIEDGHITKGPKALVDKFGPKKGHMDEAKEHMAKILKHGEARDVLAAHDLHDLVRRYSDGSNKKYADDALEKLRHLASKHGAAGKPAAPKEEKPKEKKPAAKPDHLVKTPSGLQAHKHARKIMETAMKHFGTYDHDEDPRVNIEGHEKVYDDAIKAIMGAKNFHKDAEKGLKARGEFVSRGGLDPEDEDDQERLREHAHDLLQDELDRWQGREHELGNVKKSLIDTYVFNSLDLLSFYNNR